MSKVYFIGCLHFGHENMAKWRGFQSSEEHDNNLISNWNWVVSKNDTVVVVGDITMENARHYHKMDLLNGTKILVMGNHEVGKHIEKLRPYFKSIHGAYDYKGFWVTHIPVHPFELLRKKGNIHAHIHREELPSVSMVGEYKKDKGYLKVGPGKGYYNVDAEVINYTPRTIIDLEKQLGYKEVKVEAENFFIRKFIKLKEVCGNVLKSSS